MSKKIIAHSNYIDKLLEVVHPERDSRFALVIVNRETKEVDERFISPRQIHKFIPYCRFRNSQGADIYFTPSRLLPKSRKRTKSHFQDQQKIIYLEFDIEDSISRIEDKKYPHPSAIVASSFNRHHIYWRLAESISASKQEELMRNMAYDLGADTAATDTSRLLRLPTFHNKKPERDNFQSVMIYPTKSEKISSTSFEELASFVDDYQEGELTSFSSGASHVPCGRSSIDTSQSSRDWATVNEELFREGLDPGLVIKRLESKSGRKPNPRYYAELTVKKALRAKGDIRFANL